MHTPVFYVYCASCSLMATAAFGQASPADSTFLAAATQQVQQRYADAITDQSQLYEGSEYVDYKRYYQEVKGHQFFDKSSPAAGSLIYKGHLFAGVPLLYDVRFDQIITQHPTNSFMLKLVSEQVTSFTLAGDHRFIRIAHDTTSKSSIPTGYYEVLLDNQVKLLAKRRKRIQEQPSQGAVNAEFTTIDRYYLQVGPEFYPVKGKSSVLGIFPEQRKALQKFVRDNKLTFAKSQREADLLALTRYYSTLTK